MSDYLSHIAARASGIAQENAFRPNVSSGYSAVSSPQETVVGRVPSPQETYQNPLDSFSAPKALVSVAPQQEPNVRNKNAEVSTPPQYLNKQMARFHSEKPLFDEKTNKVNMDAPAKNKAAFAENEDNYQNPMIHQIMNQVFNQNSYSASETTEKETLKQTQTGEQSKNILVPNQEKNIPFSKNTEGSPLTDAPLKMQPFKPNQTPTKLQPTALAQRGQPIKKTPPTPKLIIGRITVEVLPPPVAPVVRTIVQTEQRGSNEATTANTSFYKLSFGLGQL